MPYLLNPIVQQPSFHLVYNTVKYDMIIIFFNPTVITILIIPFQHKKQGAIQSCVIHSQSCQNDLFSPVPFSIIFNANRLLYFIIYPSFLVFLPLFLPNFNTFLLNYCFPSTFPSGIGTDISFYNASFANFSALSFLF